MRLLDLMTAPWALLPEQLTELQRIYATHLRGEKIDVSAVEARLGRTLANEQRSYTVEQGAVGLFELSGVMAPKANMLMQISGGVSTQMAAQQVRSMRTDPRVRAAILALDSPGGSVLGTPAFAEEVRLLAATKPTVALSRGTLASAAYWVGSAANAVLIEGVTDQVGSIGVYQRLTLEAAQPGQIEMVRGKYKRMSLNGQAPDPEQMAYLEAQLDHMYAVFVDAVAAHRGTSADDVLERMADGRVFIGQQAIDAGLADGISTLDALIERMAADPNEFAQRRRAVPARRTPKSAGAVALADALVSASAGDAPRDESNHEERNVMPQADNPLTRASLERDHADLFAQLRNEFTAQGHAAGATAERERIQAVRAQLLPGHEELVDRLAFDGQTTGPDAAAAVLAAERQLRQTQARAHAADAPPAVPAGTPPATEGPKSKAAQVAEAQAYAKANSCDFVAALKALGYAS
jgi:capsid assembly protease